MGSHQDVILLSLSSMLPHLKPDPLYCCFLPDVNHDLLAVGRNANGFLLYACVSAHYCISPNQRYHSACETGGLKVTTQNLKLRLWKFKASLCSALQAPVMLETRFVSMQEDDTSFQIWWRKQGSGFSINALSVKSFAVLNEEKKLENVQNILIQKYLLFVQICH